MVMWRLGHKTSKFVPSGRARRHLANLRQSYSLGEIAELSGLTLHQVKAIVTSRNALLRSTAVAIMAVKLPPGAVDLGSEEWMVPAVGTERRLKGLHINGWRLEDVSRETGIPVRTLQCIRAGGQDTTNALVHHKVREYTSHHLFQVQELSNRQWAAMDRSVQGGWAPLLAWDGEDIDDPNAKPVGMPTRRRVRVRKK